MRVAPLGAYFADGIDAVVREAEKSAKVTHAHPEAVAGAIAVAVATALAACYRGSTPPRRREFIDQVLEYVPHGRVYDMIHRARSLDEGSSIRHAVATLGNGVEISCVDTVPFALWCVGEQLSNYEEAIWWTVTGLGDRDTTCAIVGGIVAAFTGINGIPAEWRESREPLPDWPFQ
jgi:ADP-ribosylglycohydrolase